MLLQKEQGLLTASDERLSPRSYEVATGFACPMARIATRNISVLELRFITLRRSFSGIGKTPRNFLSTPG
ncbi:hypothetical protein [Mobiluncus curtisii]|uniref:hypothetical protein n=1 Tax=Mobiluncus curtisii TaxID=2051 RepID=UPI002092B4F3|nr:hypothetical protein [Mobiluncus curtisii]